MGMGYGANFAETVDIKLIEKTCKKELKAFLEAIRNTKEEDITGGTFTIDSFAMNANNGDDNPREIESAWKDLKNRFAMKTGLSLSLGYHSTDDNGDRYDEVDGHFWCVENVYMKTPAGKKYDKYIQRKFFVTFG